MLATMMITTMMMVKVVAADGEGHIQQSTNVHSGRNGGETLSTTAMVTATKVMIMMKTITTTTMTTATATTMAMAAMVTAVMAATVVTAAATTMTTATVMVMATAAGILSG